ncbi:hypothetical protein AB0E56_13135 [Microbacterium sp. NPDC028030]|uniref:hypothetical protein n=1 Tax=Microbacterium sp. NPDC028030 TaxID=3155124 RepID=UPI0033F7E3F8
MNEQRDEWGETAEERHARILARDLAWMTYAEACARDGLPRSERDHLIFNDGYAAGRADYLPSASVVAEEPEGEHVFIERYGMYHAKFGGIGGDATSLGITREAWKAMGEPNVLAVSWVPIEQEGEPDA